MSVPDTVQGAALLVNARPDKGFDLALEIAALAPNVPFLVVASQSSLEDAEDAVDAAGLFNVHIIDKVDDVAALYARAKVVLVPSYAFIETFSRVCIEAHRYGLPVIGSDVGNVPNLLKQSGVSLPPDPQAWADELTHLFEDKAYYAKRQALALENSERYSAANQRLALEGVVHASTGSLLVGVGSGIGNMLHTTPMIRNLALRLGHKIDLVIAEDHADSLFLLHNSRYVNAVYSLVGGVRRKRYRRVFLTNCFGPAPVTFAADQMLRSRDIGPFTPGQSAHETIFNLDAAQALLGVDYDQDDVLQHYVGELTYTPPAKSKLVGMHGGSKGGYWSSKRWPGFTELAKAMKAKGFRVASFGTADEYIPGTLDKTGGTIQEMAEAMLECRYMVSNDSGVMNIAAALGIPTLAIFGPTDPGTRAPLAPIHHHIAHRSGAAACEVIASDAFRGGLCVCIDQITVEQALEGFQTLIDKQEARPAAKAPAKAIA